MRILLIEDDIRLVESIKSFLQASAFIVEACHDGISGGFLIREGGFDAVVLDLGLPEKNGLAVLQEIRAEQVAVPVLILTARDSWQERVDGLKAGADDYLGKPFHLEELQARLEVLIRRNYGHVSQKLELNGVSLDLDTQIAIAESGELHALTGIEFRLLRCLLMNPGKLMSKTLISEQVYEEEHLRDSNVIEVYVNRLRQRFGKQFIRNRRGQGYYLAEQEREL
ncbi:response regulator transcription factor [Amphritea balenae]|uniref:DNA-binding response regulator n=1 Tax=Amphritea balenae TaxID=452629 RepID=A0A3P1SR06_9GAMM|nr:response regulator transcription factor [Amphritea balenae]RRC99577.1 DNA-binding response regulator [Amphritea balenae]GGK78228.1 DNA-binding response regulator [Amphritea balenae]